MAPIILLGILMLVTLGGVIIQRRNRKRAQAKYRQLGLQYHMHYSPGDPLKLTARVAAQLPIPGAAGVRVIDLLYRTDEQNHYYVFTAEYTVGVVGPKHRIRRAAAFTESKAGTAHQHKVRLGPDDLPLVDQYRALVEG